MNLEIITNSPAETQKIAEDIALKFKGVIALYGDLGFGKTTFVQGLAKGLKIKKRIISPTFVIMRSYGFPQTVLYHADLYRLQGKEEIESTGIFEILKQKNILLAIEWPEKMGSLLPEKKLEVRFEYVDENKRKILIKEYE